VFEVAVQPGDMIVAGTDGLFDNVFSEEICVMGAYCKKLGSTSAEAAEVICMYARKRAADQQYASPFAYGAHQAGFPFIGGKMDDITVVVAYVVPVSKM
jgi:protein phosphatase PTC7